MAGSLMTRNKLIASTPQDSRGRVECPLGTIRKALFLLIACMICLPWKRKRTTLDLNEVLYFVALTGIANRYAATPPGSTRWLAASYVSRIKPPDCEGELVGSTKKCEN